jgi:hypothetical protein
MPIGSTVCKPRLFAALAGRLATSSASTTRLPALLRTALHVAFFASWGYVCWLMNQTL